MIKLNELRVARAAMIDRSEWRQGSVEKHHIFARDPDALGGPVMGERVLLSANRHFPYAENLAGIVATHNAADALIAIVECLLVRDAAAVAYARAFHASGKMEHADGPEYDAMGRAERALHDAHAALKAALAEVTL